MVSALAQNPMEKGPVGLVFPVAGWPFSAQQVESRTRILPDGTSSTEEMSSQIYRDNKGRVRIEWHFQRRGIVYILDPVAHFMVTLFEQAKIADRISVPQSESGGFQGGLPGIGEPLQPLGKWQATTEALPARVIYGVEVEGSRTVQTLDNLTATQEAWLSSLGVIFEVKASGPNWSDTAKLVNLERKEPDPALFVIPSDYKVQ